MTMFVVFVGLMFNVSVQAQGVSSQYLYHSSSQTVTQNSQIVPFRYEGSSQVHYYDKVNNTIDGVPQSNRYQALVQSVQNNQQYVPQNNGYAQSYGNNQQYYDPRDQRNIQYYEPSTQSDNYLRGRMAHLIGNHNQNQPVAYVAPSTPAPGYGFDWRYSQKYHSWGWYSPNGGWYFN